VTKEPGRQLDTQVWQEGGEIDTKTRIKQVVTPNPEEDCERQPLPPQEVAQGAPVPVEYALPDATTMHAVPHDAEAIAAIESASLLAICHPDGS
jgi:hypothetical protein